MSLRSSSLTMSPSKKFGLRYPFLSLLIGGLSFDELWALGRDTRDPGIYAECHAHADLHEALLFDRLGRREEQIVIGMGRPLQADDRVDLPDQVDAGLRQGHRQRDRKAVGP